MIGPGGERVKARRGREDGRCAALTRPDLCRRVGPLRRAAAAGRHRRATRV